jgi:hypothetical protein
MIDTAEALYVLLTSDATLAGVVTDADGVHIYGPPGLPDDFTIRKAIVFLGDGGADDEYTPITREDFVFYCWAPDASQAREVYLALANFFRFKTHVHITVSGEDVIFQKANRRSGPQDRVDFQDGWSFTYAVFNLHFVERSLP